MHSVGSATRAPSKNSLGDRDRTKNAPPRPTRQPGGSSINKRQHTKRMLTFGAWPFALCLKNSGSWVWTSAAHCALEERRRVSSARALVVLIFVVDYGYGCV